MLHTSLVLLVNHLLQRAEALLERLARDAHRLELGRRADRREARLAPQQRALAEARAVAQVAQHALVGGALIADHLGRAGDDDVEGVALVALVEDVLAVGVRRDGHRVDEVADQRQRQRLEDRDRLERGEQPLAHRALRPQQRLGRDRLAAPLERGAAAAAVHKLKRLRVRHDL
eukprot:2597289-Prymnesium_polylepis.1